MPKKNILQNLNFLESEPCVNCETHKGHKVNIVIASCLELIKSEGCCYTTNAAIATIAATAFCSAKSRQDIGLASLTSHGGHAYIDKFFKRAA